MKKLLLAAIKLFSTRVLFEQASTLHYHFRLKSNFITFENSVFQFRIVTSQFLITAGMEKYQR